MLTAVPSMTRVSFNDRLYPILIAFMVYGRQTFQLACKEFHPKNTLHSPQKCFAFAPKCFAFAPKMLCICPKNALHSSMNLKLLKLNSYKEAIHV